jgi:hypothetical protein
MLQRRQRHRHQTGGRAGVVHPTTRVSSTPGGRSSSSMWTV